ncbi:MAG TPA: Rossmann-like and DUF2520 domain-containing protein [Candidatus Acidoferrales bacterium]|nr:Rossmann-like and DUF2520 domain-containing protein [Candidatus Acidoferrales bacterium]
MKQTISIIGAGRVGRTLGRRLRQLGWRIEAVVARSNAHARKAVRFIGAGKPFARFDQGVFSARVLLLTTGDSVLASVAEDLARISGRTLKGKVVLHTSGALDSRVLRPLARLGAATGSLHPMQTFSGKEPPNLTGVVFAIEGAPTARRVAGQIARELGGQPVMIDPKAKVAYHAAGTLAAGHALAVMETATQILTRAGFSRERALKALLPLTRQMLDNFKAAGPRAAWTGPLARNDYAIVSAHAKALRAYPREFQDAYAALSLLSGRVLAGDAAAAIANIRRALRKS